MMNEPVTAIMTSNVITLAPSDTLGEARNIFLSKRIHHLPIVEGDKLVGMVTSWDIFKTGLSAEEYAQKSIREVMTTKLATLEPWQKIGAAAEVLMEHLFHAIPIVDEGGRLKGIVTTYDILKYTFRREYPEDLTKFVPENM
ncbi:MAG: HPP family protein [Saprospiraceae bacterium]